MILLVSPHQLVYLFSAVPSNLSTYLGVSLWLQEYIYRRVPLYGPLSLTNNTLSKLIIDSSTIPLAEYSGT